MVEVEVGVPIAPKGPGRPTKYPWRKMEVGDSFFAEGASVKNFHAAAWRWGKALGRKFLLRQHRNGVRVHRVA